MPLEASRGVTVSKKYYLKVRTAFVIGQPITNEQVGSRVTSETSEIQSDSHTSDRGTCN